jgi:hypothetical protein
MVWLTLWRLRPSNSNDAVEIKDLVHESDPGPAREWTPERMAADWPIHEGQMVRLTIESFRSGYLYVIDRPKYRDGSYGEAHLIFPTQQIYGGNNKVEVGRTIQLPGPDDKPNYFRLKRSESRQGEPQVAEELIIIVKPEPFESFKTAPPRAQSLTPQSVEAIITKFSTAWRRSEMNGGAGQPITEAEVKAARDKAKLDDADPFPQTVFRATLKPTDPMLVKMELKVE